ERRWPPLAPLQAEERRSREDRRRGLSLRAGRRRILVRLLRIGARGRWSGELPRSGGPEAQLALRRDLAPHRRVRAGGVAGRAAPARRRARQDRNGYGRRSGEAGGRAATAR